MINPNDCDRWWGKDHEFGKWLEIESGTLSRTYAPDSKVGHYVKQKRTCERCGFQDIDTQTSTL